MSIPTYRGRAIPVISFAPNWGAGMRFGLRQKTIVTEALSVREERQNKQPRHLYALMFATVGLDARETEYLRSVVERADDLPVACPLWPVQVALTEPATATDLALDLDTTADCLFGVFHEYALLWSAFDNWEIVELDAVTANGATLLASVAGEYPAGSVLVPLAYGYVPRGPVEQLTDEHGVWRCEFRETFHRLHDQSVPEDDAVPERPVYDFFEYALGDVSNVNEVAGGSGWAAAPNISPNTVASVARDFFEDYALGALPGIGLARGVGWAAAADVATNYARSASLETFESYTVGAVTSADLVAGDGWSGAASIVANA